jgi:cobalt/nickel transport system permease protein
MELRGFQGRFPETGAESSVCASLLLVILTLVWCMVCRNLG